MPLVAAYRRGTRIGLFVQVDGLMPIPLEATLIAGDISPQRLVTPKMGVWPYVNLLLDILLHACCNISIASEIEMAILIVSAAAFLYFEDVPCRWK